MFTISKNETTLDRPALKQQSDTIVSFTYSNPGVLRNVSNSEDFSNGVEEVLAGRGFHILPGASDILASWHDGSSFIVTIRGFAPTSVIYLNDVSIYKSFMKEYGSCASVWHVVAPFPKHEPVNPANYIKYDPRRGY